jgi:hypothetical protein
VPAFNRQKELYFLLLWFAQSPGRQSSQAPLNICTQFTSLKTKKIKAGQENDYKKNTSLSHVQGVFFC